MKSKVKPNADGAASNHAIRKILVVDDSRLQRRILTVSLQKWGYDVTEAESGVQALNLCREDPPDLVLSDWMMPEMDGLEFCREFKKMDREGYGYFILLTSKSEKGEIARGLESGADDFLTKPPIPVELRARIEAGERIVHMQRELTDKNRLVESTLHELQTLYDSLNTDLIEAKKLQQSLVSERHRDFGPAEVTLLLRSSGHVGGDLVGTYPISKTRVGLYAIDVSGHGVSSALMTARLAGYLSATNPDQNVGLFETSDGSYAPRAPKETIAILNDLILSELETEHYFTLLLADADLETGSVTISQAGHPHPAIQRATGEVEISGLGGLPVGLIEGASYDEFTIHLAPGDRLLMCSDGVGECADKRGQLLGDTGLTHIFRDLRETKGMSFLEALIWRLVDFAGTEEFADDVSAILLEFKPARTG